MKDAINYRPNISPHVGAIAIFRYPHGVGHVALVTALHNAEFSVTEANYHHCQQGDRWVSLNDPNLVGFYNPAGDSGVAGS